MLGSWFKADRSNAHKKRPVTETQHIYLTGYRGTGKTSVAKILADRLGRPMVDLDDLVESTAGCSIAQIFAKDGEPAFRDLETECLETVAKRSAAADPTGGEIVSLGGGAILRERNRSLIADSGVCIWLYADAQTLSERILGDQTSEERRPALTDLDHMQEIRQLLGQREPLYRSVAQHHFDTSQKTIQQIAEEIIDAVDA